MSVSHDPALVMAALQKIGSPADAIETATALLHALLPAERSAVIANLKTPRAARTGGGEYRMRARLARRRVATTVTARAATRVERP